MWRTGHIVLAAIVLTQDGLDHVGIVLSVLVLDVKVDSGPILSRTNTTDIL